MRPDSAAFDALLGSLADGTPIDWTALEAEAQDDRGRRRVRNMRLVARVAELHRSQPIEEDAAPEAMTASVEPPATWGRLQLGPRLASGSYGAVYRAHDPSLNRDVALKLLRTRADGADTARLLSEAQALAKISHRNVVIVHGADTHDAQSGLWMELIDGETLAALSAARGRLGADETIAIGRDVCRALSAIHAAELVHGDVKTQNVMRESGGRIVLMDFGAGRRLGATHAATGTPLYLAPEVLAGGPPTRQSDLYSLGVLMFTLLTGRYPYEADGLAGLRRAHADGARVYLRDLRPDLPDALVDTVERALESDAAARFPTAGAMEHALANEPRPQRARWTWPLVALVAAAVVAAATLMWPRGPSSLAVLPFSSSNADFAYLVEGLNRDLVRTLQQGYDVQVRTTAGMTDAVKAAGLGGQLRVDAIVAGQAVVNVSGRVLTVTIQRGADVPFWTRTYAIPDSELPSLASRLAREVSSELGIRERRGATPLYQPNQVALQAYYHGRSLADRREQNDLTQSVEHYKLAVRTDPGYAEAWTGLADSYIALAVPPFGDLRPMEARVLARQALDRALALNRDLAEAETSLAWAIASFDWDWPAAEVHFKRALTLNPQYALAHHWYAMLLTDLGRFDEAIAELTRAQDVQPLSVLIQRDFGWIYFMAARYDDAERVLRETLKRDPDFWPAITLLARSLAAKGDTGGALAELERGRLDPDRRTGYLSFRGYIEAAAGDPRASDTLGELRAHAQSAYVPPYYFALIYTALGRRDEALAELQRAQAEQDTTMTSVNVDPRFATLRADPRFQAIVSAMRFASGQRGK